MKIENAIVVTIDFDNDIKFDRCGVHVFTEKEEVIELVRDALKTMNNKRPTYKDYALDDIDKISTFIYLGGSEFGNWEIRIDFTNEKMQELF